MKTSSWQPEYHGLWPKPQDEWLLKAALADESACAEHFARWRAESGFQNYDEIDYATCRILPMVYKQLVRSGADDPWLPQMKALHRYHWVTIKAKQQRLAKLIDELGRVGIETVVLKGNALIAGGYFDDAGERPLHDLDVLVRPEDEASAAERVRWLDWKELGPGPHAEYHAFAYRYSDGVELDLHRKLFQPPYRYVGLDSLLPFSKPAVLCGVRVRIPDATHLLMHCLVHGRVCWGSVGHPFLWVADAMRILQRAPDGIDWARLLEDAERFAIVFDIRESLGYLRDKLNAPVPDHVLQKLKDALVRREDMLPFFRWTNQHEIHSLLELKDFMHADYLCHQQMADREPTRLGYLRYVSARMHRLMTSDAGRKRIYFLSTKLRYEGLLSTIRRPNYLKVPGDTESP